MDSFLGAGNIQDLLQNICQMDWTKMGTHPQIGV